MPHCSRLYTYRLSCNGLTKQCGPDGPIPAKFGHSGMIFLNWKILDLSTNDYAVSFVFARGTLFLIQLNTNFVIVRYVKMAPRCYRVQRIGNTQHSMQHQLQLHTQAHTEQAWQPQWTKVHYQGRRHYRASTRLSKCDFFIYFVWLFHIVKY